MTDKWKDADEDTLARYEAALGGAGYEVYEQDGGWYYNDVGYERDHNLADGPYDTKGQALEIAVRNLGLDAEEDEEPDAPRIG